MTSVNEAAVEGSRVGKSLTDWEMRKRSKLKKAALVKEVSNARWLTTKVPDVFRKRFPHLFTNYAPATPPPSSLPDSVTEPG